MTIAQAQIAATAGINVTRLVGNVRDGSAPFAQEAGRTDNVFKGFVPVTKATALLDFPIEEKVPHIEVNGVWQPVSIKGKGRKVYYRPDVNDGLGMHGETHSVHPYVDFIANAKNLLDSEIGIESVGYTDLGASAWLTVSMKDFREGPGGIKHKPFLMLSSSLDGTLATSAGMCSTIAVCKNTFAMAIAEAKNGRYSVKHTKNGRFNVTDARDTLGLILSYGDALDAQLEAWLATPVTDAGFDAILDAVKPIPAASTTVKGDGPGRGVTMAQNYRERVKALYLNDPRVAPWQGNLFGVYQAFNTDLLWNSQVKGDGADRLDRNIGNVLSGAQAKADTEIMAKALKALATV